MSNSGFLQTAEKLQRPPLSSQTGFCTAGKDSRFIKPEPIIICSDRDVDRILQLQEKLFNYFRAAGQNIFVRSVDESFLHEVLKSPTDKILALETKGVLTAFAIMRNPPGNGTPESDSNALDVLGMEREMEPEGDPACMTSLGNVMTDPEYKGLMCPLVTHWENVALGMGRHIAMARVDSRNEQSLLKFTQCGFTVESHKTVQTKNGGSVKCLVVKKLDENLIPHPGV